MSSLLLRRLSDEHLGRRLATGEAAAFDELYRRYVYRLAAYGANLLGDGASGDDVAQSALLKAYAALRAGRVPDRVKPWLYRIAHNAGLDLIARRAELAFEEVPERLSAAPAHSESALVTALAALPERQRRVYVMRELHGCRIDETAEELGLTAPQVEQALFAARNRLAEHLVFGDRLNCVAVRRLAQGPLDLDERRALRSHLHSCPGCRAAVGPRATALGLASSELVGWLRTLPGLLAGTAAPTAVKIGAVVVAATVVGGAPLGYEVVKDRNPERGTRGDTASIRVVHKRVTAPRPPAPPKRPAPRFAVASATVSVNRTQTTPAKVSHGDPGDNSGRRTSTPRPTTRSRGGDDRRAPASDDASASAAPAPTVTPAVADDGGGGDSGRGNGSGRGDRGGGTGDSGSGSD